MTVDPLKRGPLTGITVVNFATMLGAGHATALLADFGADVISAELPGRGDALRDMGPFAGGRSLRWAVVGRGKRSLTLDLRRREGQAIAGDLTSRADVVIENFRPGTMAKWGLGYEVLRDRNPGIVMLSLSGYGQTGPDAGRAGFGRVIEAISGYMHATGNPDGPPTQMGVPLTDYIAGTFGAMAVAMALVARAHDPAGAGQHIDLSLYETMVRLNDAQLTRYAATGEVPNRMGNRYLNIAPSDVYLTADERYVFHSSATQTVFVRLMRAIGADDLVHDDRFRTNADRVRHRDEINDIVAEWFRARTLDEVQRVMDRHDVPIGPVRTIAEVAADPHLRGRDSITDIEVEGIGPVTVPGLVPKFSATPGSLDRQAPALGEHTNEVLRDLLGYDERRIAALRAEGVV